MNAISPAEPRESSSIIRIICLLACLFLILAPASLLMTACSKSKAEKEGRGEGVPVTTGVVTQKDVPLEVRAIGTVEALSVVAVKSQVGGELTKVHFTEGQFVKKDDVLFTIDPRPYEAALSQAEANLARSRASEKQAEANLARDTAQAKTAAVQADRYANLLATGVVSNDQYDQYRTNADALAETVRADKANVETIKKQIEADTAAVESARLQLGFTTLRSPIEGRTGSLMVYQGNLVRTTDTTPLVMINQVNPIHVTFSLPEKQLPEIKRYMARGKLSARVTPANDDQHPEAGTVDFVDNAVDNTTGTIKLKCVFANKERRLWPGQFVNVVLTLTTQTGAVVAPAQAVQTGQQGQYVFVVKKDQTVELRPVVVAHTDTNFSVIESGVKPGEVVVTDGQVRLVPGAKVKVKSGEQKLPL